LRLERRTGRWPVKSAKFLANLIRNAEANAVANELDAEVGSALRRSSIGLTSVQDLIIRVINIQQAPKTHRRTYRAHGRINPYKGSLQASRSGVWV
jgi:large subunit ribosomal protein L17e